MIFGVGDAAGFYTNAQRVIVIEALNNQQKLHFAPNWNGACSTLVDITNTPSNQIPAIDLALVLRAGNPPPDDAGAAADHYVTSGDIPQIEIWCGVCQSANIPVSFAMSHEVCETTIDPYICATVLDTTNQCAYIMECCDPVADTNDGTTPLGYKMPNGTVVSNFVFPAYFDTNSPTGIVGRQYDYLKTISAPVPTFGAGGYLGKWTPATGWTMLGQDHVLRTALSRYKIMCKKGLTS